MAAYPTYCTMMEGSKRTLRDDLVADYAVNGAMQQRAYYTVFRSDFSLKHLLSSTNFGLWKTFYSDNRLLTMTLTWNSASFTVRFKGPYRETWKPHGWEIEVDLAEA